MTNKPSANTVLQAEFDDLIEMGPSESVFVTPVLNAAISLCARYVAEDDVDLISKARLARGRLAAALSEYQALPGGQPMADSDQLRGLLREALL